MNLLIGFVILICLICSEIHTAELATDIWTRVILVALVSLSVPGLALFQTLVISKRMRDPELASVDRESIIRRVAACHSAVWLIASLAMIWAVRWQDVVRVNWNLDRWPLLDDMILIAPVVLSLVASWVIFYENQQTLDTARPGGRRWIHLKPRIRFVSLRFQVYFLVILIPIAVTILARDLNPWLTSLSIPIQVMAYSVSGLLLMAAFPFLLLFFWTNQSAPEPLRKALIQTCQQQRLCVFDIRIWKTEGRIVNALVAGILPWCRIIMISDRLVEIFPTNELLAVVRHEGGHLRYWHLPIRIALLVIPLLAFGFAGPDQWSMAYQLEIIFTDWHYPAGTSIAILILLYIFYLRLVLPWVAHQMEFEADLHACVADSDRGAKPVLVDSRIQDLSNALQRFALLSPERIDQKRLLHPSIQNRIERLKEIKDCPDQASRLFMRAAQRRWIVLGLLLLGGLLSGLVHLTW